MKKIAVTLGLATAGSTVVHAAYAPDTSQDKLWSVSCLLRGIYNDNPATVNQNAQGAFGYQVSPQFQGVKPYNQTELGLRYIYNFTGYVDQNNQNVSPYLQTHLVNLWLDHVFNERWEAKVNDSIVSTQDPILGVNGQGTADNSISPFHNGNFVNNTAQVSVHTDWTRELGTVVTYQNSLTLFNQDGFTTNGPAFITPSDAAQFNRMDQTITFDFQWHTSPETVYGIGYSYQWVNYLSQEPISPVLGPTNVTPTIVQYVPVFAPGASLPYYHNSDYQNFYTHTLYLSYQHNLSDTFRITAAAGGQLTDSYNQQNGSQLNPYANITASYNYAPGSYVSGGFSQMVNSTYLPAQNGYYYNLYDGTLTEFQESSTVFMSVNHQISPKLVGRIDARFQRGAFHGGPYSNVADDYYNLSANLNYNFTRHFSAEIGYAFSQTVSSESSSSFTQNQFEIGVTGAY